MVKSIGLVAVGPGSGGSLSLLSSSLFSGGSSQDGEEATVAMEAMEAMEVTHITDGINISVRDKRMGRS